LTWGQVAKEAGYGLEIVSAKTVKKELGSLDYHKCIACIKGWTAPANKDKRCNFARAMLDIRPKPKNWHNVWFSDEVHFGYGPKMKMRVIRKLGQRYCPDCMQFHKEPDDKDRKRFHGFGAFGYNVKFFILYSVDSNTNGKMTQRVYIDSILQLNLLPMMKERGMNVTLEEDGDSGHTGKVATAFKEKHGIKYYINATYSPDLSPAENCWQPIKQYFRTEPHFDDAGAEKAIWEAFKRLPQSFINRQVESMPQRLGEVLQSGGEMTGW
ncbi:hypothetical protein EJ08DRAFT_600893, partial [Tothia fuscella]